MVREVEGEVEKEVKKEVIKRVRAEDKGRKGVEG